MIYYAGIGSRKCPGEILEMCEKLGYAFAKKGFCLRSGGAEGCDNSFEFGCDRGEGKKNIFLPWRGFNGNSSPLYAHSDLAEEIAFRYHPNLYGQSDGVIKLMSRNTHQVLGLDCKTPSDFVVYYAPEKNGIPQGGTAQAIRISKAYSIKSFNLLHKEKLAELKEYIKGLEDED